MRSCQYHIVSISHTQQLEPYSKILSRELLHSRMTGAADNVASDVYLIQQQWVYSSWFTTAVCRAYYIENFDRNINATYLRSPPRRTRRNTRRGSFVRILIKTQHLSQIMALGPHGTHGGALGAIGLSVCQHSACGGCTSRQRPCPLPFHGIIGVPPVVRACCSDAC